MCPLSHRIEDDPDHGDTSLDPRAVQFLDTEIDLKRHASKTLFNDHRMKQVSIVPNMPGMLLYRNRINSAWYLINNALLQCNSGKGRCMNSLADLQAQRR